MQSESSHAVKAARELGDNYKETAGLLSGYLEGVKEVNSLYDHGYGGAGKALISLGFTVFMIPEPTMISDVLGCGIMAAGAVYNRVVPPPMFVDDIFKNIEDQVAALSGFRESLQQNYCVNVDFSGMRIGV